MILSKDQKMAIRHRFMMNLGYVLVTICDVTVLTEDGQKKTRKAVRAANKAIKLLESDLETTM